MTDSLKRILQVNKIVSSVFCLATYLTGYDICKRKNATGLKHSVYFLHMHKRCTDAWYLPIVILLMHIINHLHTCSAHISHKLCVKTVRKNMSYTLYERLAVLIFYNFGFLTSTQFSELVVKIVKKCVRNVCAKAFYVECMEKCTVSVRNFARYPFVH